MSQADCAPITGHTIITGGNSAPTTLARRKLLAGLMMAPALGITVAQAAPTPEEPDAAF